MQTETPTESYFQLRCNAIGLTPEKNKLCTPEHPALPNTKIIEYPLLCEDAKTGDVIVPIYGIDGHPANYYQDNSGKLQSGKTKPFEVRRIHPDRYKTLCEEAIKNNAKEPGKYHTPKGAKTYPWIAPNIIDAYRKKQHIDTIVITEGYIKSICGYLNGLYMFGLSGIQNGKDKDTGAMHSAILDVIDVCQVNNVVLLYDGDCNMISLKALEDGKDLRKRPAGFLSSATNLNELLKDARKERHFDVYFASINTNDLQSQENGIAPKGLDDLFEQYNTDGEKIVKELTSFSKQKPYYFTKINITMGMYKVINHLHINSHETFYTAHNQIIQTKAFVFGGTKWQWDEQKKTLNVIIPGAAKNYFRVGDNYFEKIQVPNKYGVLEYRYDKRLKSTITEDHGKNLVNHIPKYKAFCIKPDHVQYQEVIDNCFNRYKPFEHEVGTTDDCPETLEFFKHIFGEQYELGLDYVQLLLQQPTQMLPILCLVSRENNTGKSTFGKLLKAIFTGNMAIIGNADLENDFNAGWADKLIICCEESFIDKKKTVEKIKSLSTGDKIQINQKGIDQVEIDFFGKFLFMSNNENNFVIANEHDERFWVRRVPKAKQERTNLLEIMIEEIPQFLYFLNKRNLSVKKESRMFFAPSLLRTEALEKLIEGNRSGPQKELTSILRNWFTDTGFWQLKFTLKYICEKILRNRFERNYIHRILNENMHVEALSKTERFYVPEISQVHEGGHLIDKIVCTQIIGKPFVFNADKFLSPDEIEQFELSDDAIHHGQIEHVPTHIAEKTRNGQQTMPLEAFEQTSDIVTNPNKKLPF